MMANLMGHEAGNGGYSQEKPAHHRACVLLYRATFRLPKGSKTLSQKPVKTYDVSRTPNT